MPMKLLPRIARLGVALILAGLVLDGVVHALIVPGSQVQLAGFSFEEHAAHLVVIVGMVLVIVGVMVDGTRVASRNTALRKGENDAVR
jgi:hypothetical protein